MSHKSKQGSIELIVDGTPIPKARPRVERKRTYTPMRTREYENRIAMAYYQGESRQCKFAEGAIRVTILFQFEIPRSWNREKRNRALLGFIQPTGRNNGDIDNLIKAVLDGLNRVAYEDDCQVVEIKAAMTYGTESQTRIKIESAELPGYTKK